MKIASQRLRLFLPPILGVARALCGESLLPFRIRNLQIPLPATPFLSHPCKTPGVSPSLLFVFRTQCLCVALFLATLLLPAACSLLNSLGSLFATPVVCFQCFTASFAKMRGWGGHPECLCGTPGWGVPRSKVGQPFLAVLRRSPDNPPSKPNGGPMPAKPALPSNPPSECLHLPLRTPIPCSPKWSIIPAPASATRLRGRSV